jgi:Glycosyl transferases group 1
MIATESEEVKQATATRLPEALAPLPYPVYFVYPSRERWDDQLRTSPPSSLEDVLNPDAAPERFWDCNDCWIMQTYLQLRRRGLDVRLVVDRPVPGAINVMMGTDLGVRSLSYDCYMVLCRNDCYRPRIGSHTIVQNPKNIAGPGDHLIQLWPQPGLISRDPSRGDRVERLIFKGDERNLWEPFRAESFRSSLSDLGLEFRIDGKPDDKSRLDWHDYRDADLVLAIRDLTETDFDLKPASKLINAWHAGTPALLGPESAYQALRRSELDYVEIRTPDDAIKAANRLSREPGLYRSMVENGRARVREFTVDAVATCWRDVLAGPVADGYRRWSGQPSWQAAFSRPLQYAVRAVFHERERRRYFWERDHGYRPISGRYT